MGLSVVAWARSTLQAFDHGNDPCNGIVDKSVEHGPVPGRSCVLGNVAPNGHPTFFLPLLRRLSGCSCF